MISRRLVRIKTLQGLYAWQQTGDVPLLKGQNELAENLLMPYEVYLFLLEFPVEFQHFLDSEKEAEKNKYYPDKNLIRDCGLLANSRLAADLYNEALLPKRRKFNIQWASAAENFSGLFAELRELDFVRDHLVFDTHTSEQEKLFFDSLYTYLINGSEAFYALMEDLYNYWNEDEPLLLKEVLRTIQSVKNGALPKLASRPLRSDEDVDFGIRLFGLVVEHGEDYEKIIQDVTDNWDPARIAILDLFAIKMAIAEYLNFPEIPVKVTINEYLDIVKDYSTPGSSRFLNGILDKIRKKLEESQEIRKTGRGLRDR